MILTQPCKSAAVVRWKFLPCESAWRSAALRSQPARLMQYGHDQHEQQRLQQQQQQQQQQAFNVRPPATQLPPPAVPSGDSAPWAHLLSDAPAQAGLMQQAPGIGTFGGLPGSSAAGGANAPLIPHLSPGVGSAPPGWGCHTCTAAPGAPTTTRAGEAGALRLCQLKLPCPVVVGSGGRSSCLSVRAVVGEQRLSCADASSSLVAVCIRLTRVLACVQGAPTTPPTRSFR